MPLTNAYTTLAALKGRLHVAGSENDGRLESTITTASRQIEAHTGRRFYAASETRYYSALNPYVIEVNDLLSVTTLKTDEDGDRTYEITWNSGRDYYLWPDNAALDNRPYDAIKIDFQNGLYTFPTTVQRGVQIVGSFGYCTAGSHPPAIEEACLRLSERLFMLSNAPLGVTGSPELGLMRVVSDRDLMDLLWPYTRRRGFA